MHIKYRILQWKVKSKTEIKLKSHHTQKHYIFRWTMALFRSRALPIVIDTGGYPPTPVEDALLLQ